jgi:hypothetical protein
LTALAVWLGIVVNRVREQREAVKAIEALGGDVYYDWQAGPSMEPVTHRRPNGPGWLRRTIGDDYFQEVIVVNLAGSFNVFTSENVPPVPEVDIKALIPRLKRLRGLKEVWTLRTISNALLHELENALPNVSVGP